MSNIKNKKTSAKSAVKGNTPLSSAKIPPYSIWLVLGVVFIVFLPSLSNNFVNWDDPKYVLDNIYIKNMSWDGIKAMFTNFYGGNYHPLTAISNAIEYKIFGLNPKPFHFFNLLIHLANTFLVFKVIKLICSDARIALVVSLLFGIHPMHVESVAWISERKDVLYTFFYLIAIIQYIKFQEGKNVSRNYFLLFVAFLCALLSKSAAVTLPLTLLLIDYYLQKKINLSLLINKIPLFVLSLIFGIVAIHSQKSEGALSDLTPVFSLVDRIFLVVYSIQFYLVKFFLPIGLSAFHGYPEKINNLLPWYYYFSPFIIGLVLFIIYKLKKFQKELILGFLFFFVNIILVIQVIPVGQAMVAERYSYFSYIGLFFIAAHLFFYLIDNFKNNKTYYIAGGVACLLLLSGSAFSRNKVWKDGVTLWNDVIEKDSKVSFAYYNLGNAYKNIKNFQAAIDAYSGAIRTKPGYIEAYYNKAHAYADMQNHQSAIEDYTQIIQLSPKSADAYYNRAISESALKNYKIAIEDFSAALKINPKNSDAYYNRGNMKASLNLFEDAAADYTLSIQENPQHSNSYNNRGNCKLNLNRMPEACEDWKMSLQLGNNIATDMINKYCK